MLALLVAVAATVSMVVTQQPGPQNVHVRYHVTGPYEGRVCVDIDTPNDEHAAAFCANDEVHLKAGEADTIDESLHGPTGEWKMRAVLPDTPDNEPAITSDFQTVVVEPTKSARSN